MGGETALEEELDLEGRVEGVSQEQVKVVVVVHLEVKLGSLYVLPYLHGVLLELHGIGSCGEREGVEDEEAGLQGDILEVILS